MGDAFACLPLPSGVPVPMCFCGDSCKVAKSDEEKKYNQMYWICENYAFYPTPRQIRVGSLVRMYIFCSILVMSYIK